MLIDIWGASLPVCGNNSIFRKLQRYINHINTLSKFIDQRLLSEKYRMHFSKFNILFDICHANAIYWNFDAVRENVVYQLQSL